MILRPAALDDADFLLRLRNDPVTRANSHTSAEIERETHLQWLAHRLDNDRVKIYVAEESGVRVGTIHAHRFGGPTELSWAVAPECRAQGLGREMLRLMVALTPERLCAQIKVSNGPSRAIARAAGFSLQREDDGVCHYWRG